MAAYEDPNPLINGEPGHIQSIDSPINDINIVTEYRKRSSEACCNMSCCCMPISYYCCGMTLLLWWLIVSFIIIILVILYLCSIIVCSQEMNEKYEGGCNFVDIWVGTVFSIQILCVFVVSLAIWSMCKVIPTLMIPILAYCILQFIVAIVQFFVYLFSGILIIIIVGLEFWVFYKNYRIVKISTNYYISCIIIIKLLYR